jgi:hypothetical protein
MTARDKARLLGLLFGIYTIFSIVLVVAIAVVYIVLFGTLFRAMPTNPGDPDMTLMLPILIAIMIGMVVFAIIFHIPEMVAAHALRKDKPWAKVWTIIASALACLSFPLGTALGVFGLIFTFSDEGKQYFDDLEAGRGELGQSGNAAPPPLNSWQ